MKLLATIVENGRCIGIVDGPDEVNQHIVANGKKWHFDFDKTCGPLWLCADGWTPRKNQNPPDYVWRAFELWHRKFKQSEEKALTGT